MAIALLAMLLSYSMWSGPYLVHIYCSVSYVVVVFHIEWCIRNPGLLLLSSCFTITVALHITIILITIHLFISTIPWIPNQLIHWYTDTLIQVRVQNLYRKKTAFIKVVNLRMQQDEWRKKHQAAVLIQSHKRRITSVKVSQERRQILQVSLSLSLILRFEGLRVYFSILLASYSMLSAAPDSSGVPLS